MIAFVPSSADEMNIMRAESPGPSVEKMVPKVRETALTLYAIYTTMTVILVIALIIAGMVGEGVTTVENIQYIDRGYENVVEKLSALGADIRRVEVKDAPAVVTAG